MKVSGNNLQRGVEIPALDHKKKWHFTPLKKGGGFRHRRRHHRHGAGDADVVHKILVPHGLMGTIRSIKEGDYNIDETVAVVDTPNGSSQDLTLLQRWPVRVGRPYKQKLSPDMPLVTGQRVIDTLFPIAKGGVAAVPGPFGSGKTVVQHQLAKWAEADIDGLYRLRRTRQRDDGCLNEFPELKDPKTGFSLIGTHRPDRQHL